MTKIAELYESLEYGTSMENTTLAYEWLDAHSRRFGHFVDGGWTDPGLSADFATFAPATGEELANVAQGSEADVDRAVGAARKAAPGWAKLSGSERARYLYAIGRGLQRDARLFAVLETMNSGKPVRESRDLDIPLVARHFIHHAGWAQLADTELVDYRPIGVVGQIIPWNFPLLMLSWKVAPALAMGNTVVLKPAEFTPLTALLFAELCRSIGLPPGVLNVVTGDGDTGAALVAHEQVDKIAFTGSTEVGRVIRRATAGTGKRLSLELGGKSPFLVYEDADLDAVVEGVVDAIWFNQGQVCCAGSRILVQEGLEEVLVRKLKARMETLRMGDPLDKNIDMGAIIAPVQLERIERLVDQGRSEGADVWQPSWTVPREGWFYPPTLCTDVSSSSVLVREEIFGPVVTVMSFRTPAESVTLANDTRYGLAASVWTEDINTALDIAPQLAAGTVWVNCTNVFDAASGFGGYRESGFGREGGLEGLWEYVRPGWMAAAKRRPLREPVSVEGDLLGVGMQAPTGSDGWIDRTPKLYIGGKQVRPDAEYALLVRGADGTPMGQVPRGNRKDVRNAVEAAHAAAPGWASRTAHNRAQVLYYLAENLAPRRDEFVARLRALTGAPKRKALREFDHAVDRLFTYAAWADKWDGAVHHTPFRTVTLAMPEPWGVLGVVCPDEAPLLGLVSLLGPALAVGNAVVVVPSIAGPLLATDFYQVLETSDVPAGVVNIVTGDRDELATVLADHDDVPAVWYFGTQEGSREVEFRSAGNMKFTWVDHGLKRDWYDVEQAEGRSFLRHATQIKNVWVPYGA